MSVPPWIASALHHASQHFAGGQRRFATDPHNTAIIAEHLLERIPMPAIQAAIEAAAGPGHTTLIAQAIAERASRAVIRVLADPIMDAPNDRDTYLEVSAALDRCGAPREHLGKPLTLAERVCALGAQRFTGVL